MAVLLVMFLVVACIAVAAMQSKSAHAYASTLQQSHTSQLPHASSFIPVHDVTGHDSRGNNSPVSIVTNDLAKVSATVDDSSKHSDSASRNEFSKHAEDSATKLDQSLVIGAPPVKDSDTSHVSKDTNVLQLPHHKDQDSNHVASGDRGAGAGVSDGAASNSVDLETIQHVKVLSPDELKRQSIEGSAAGSLLRGNGGHEGLHSTHPEPPTTVGTIGSNTAIKGAAKVDSNSLLGNDSGAIVVQDNRNLPTAKASNVTRQVL